MRDLHPYLEVVAVLLPPLVLAAVLAVVVAGAVRRDLGLVGTAASWVLFGVVAVLVPWLPASTGEPVDGITVAVANAMVDNATPREAAADILAVDADVVVVPENSHRVHRHLAEAYPFANRTATYRSWVGVYSRLPAELLPDVEGLFDDRRHARVRIEGPEPFVLWALHLPRPWFTSSDSFQLRPRRHARALDEVLDAIGLEDLPVVVAGDLNLTDRGRGYRRFTADLDDAMRSAGGRRTALKPRFRALLLRIDHILEPEDWCADEARRYRVTGSDHRGITARIGPCRRP